MRVFLVLFFLLASSSLSNAEPADCQVELKATDGYQQLSEKLKCVWDHVKRLEAARAKVGDLAAVGPSKIVVPGAQPTVVSGTKILPSGCFDVDPGGKLNGTYIVAIPEGKTKHFCWNDGSLFVSFLAVEPDHINYTRPDGNKNSCSYNSRCFYSLTDGGYLYFWPQRLLFGENDTPRVKVTLKFKRDE